MIKGPTAKRGAGILVVTTLVLGVGAACLVGGCIRPQYSVVARFLPAAIIGLLALGCYLRSPVAYEITEDKRLVTRLHWGSREFGPVKTAAVISRPASFGIRLWGNGGLFAATGIYWNRTYGRFRAYVTNSRKLVLVELEDGGKIIISPENCEEWQARPCA